MLTSVAEPLLDIADVHSGYGKIVVLHGVTMHIKPGEVVALLGPNGAGKSTLLRTISGLIACSAGSMRFSGESLGGLGPRGTVQRGLAHIIEGHRIFTQQTVYDNLLLAGYDVPRSERKARIEEALTYFPEIAAKRNDAGSTLSGGQQQMLAVAQGLVQKPKLLMLDEPSAGLSPVLVDRVLAVVDQLRVAGTAVLLVEQLIEKALSVSDRVYALAQGRVVLEQPANLPDLPRLLERAYLDQN